MGRPKKKVCGFCRRTIPTKNGVFYFHYIQDPGWCKSDGSKDECEGSGQTLEEIKNEIQIGSAS